MKLVEPVMNYKLHNALQYNLDVLTIHIEIFRTPQVLNYLNN